MPQNLITKTILIDGMTCANCENRIENKLKKTTGIVSIKVSYSSSTAKVTFDLNVIKLEKIEKIIEGLDYTIKKSVLNGKNIVADKKNNINQLIGIGIIVLAVFIIGKHFGLFNIFNNFPQAKEGVGYGVLFLIGLLTSIHCVAMCGGINLSQCVSKYSIKSEKSLNLRPSILYNLGRVISYTAIGGVVGGIGSVISFSGMAKGIVAIVAGIFMVIMGLNMLNVFPQLRKFNIRMPKIFARKINDEKNRVSNSPLYVGLFNGLMPCGPLQAMQLYALSTGNPIKGALSMLLFSLGTVPLMFGLGTLSSFLSKKFTSKMLQVSSILVIVLGIFMFQNGIGVSGISLPSLSTKQAKISNSSVAIVNNDIQSITTKLSSRGYEAITVQVGIPVKWTIQAANGTINGCNRTIIIPGYNIEKTLEIGDNVIEFTPSKSGTIPYSCSMGMIRSQINVVDDLNKVDVGKIQDENSNVAQQTGGCCAQ